jgi:hypothetical protein
LNEAAQGVSAEIYKAGAEQAKAGPSGGPPPPEEPKNEGAKKDDGTIIDAEVVDEKKS